MTRVLVHFHVYYEDQIPWFLENLRQIKGCEWDLYVTASVLSQAAKEEILAVFPHAILMPVENVGYDVWPFVKVLKAIDFDRYEYVLKLHTKSDSVRGARWNGSGGTAW